MRWRSLALLVLAGSMAACGLSRRGGSRDPRVPPSDAGSHDAGRAPPATSRPDAGAPVTDAGRPSRPPGVPARIEIYSGNGMMVMGGWPSGDTMKVRVTDESDAPVPDVPVAWDVLEGGAALTGDFATGAHGVSRTDDLGLARAGIRGEFLACCASAARSRFRASIDAGEVELHAFSTYYDLSIPATPETYLPTDTRDLGTQRPGAVVRGAVVAIVAFQAGADRGRGVSGVGLRLVPDDEWSDLPPPVACANATEGGGAGGTVFTDGAGRAICDVRVPSTPGAYSFGVRVGGAIDFSPFFVRVE